MTVILQALLLMPFEHMPRLLLPSSLTSSSARALLQSLPDGPGGSVELDPARVAFVKVAGAVLLVEGLHAYAERTGRKVVLDDPPSPASRAHGYLSTIGFFRELGSTWGYDPPSKPGTTYLPITPLYRDALDDEAASTNRPLGVVIGKRCTKLATLLTQRNDGKTVEPVAYALRELVRNVFEHSGGDRCTLAGQWMPRQQRAEIVVADSGVGVRATLAQRHPVNDDEEALRLAVLPGRSGSPTFGEDDPWSNSGFGLYVLSELGRRTGSVRVLSGDAVLSASAKHPEFTAGASHWGGTAVELCVTKPKGTNLRSLIEAIVEEGESGARRASASTRLVV